MLCVEPDAPSGSGQSRRLSKRAAQGRFAWWRRVGFDRHYSFHSLRHSAMTPVYRLTRNLFLALQFDETRFAAYDNDLHSSGG